MKIWIRKELLKPALHGVNVAPINCMVHVEEPPEDILDCYQAFEDFFEPNGKWLVKELNDRPDTWQDYLMNADLEKYTLKTNPGCEPLYELEVPRLGFRFTYLKANDSTPWIYIGYCLPYD